MDVKHVKKNTIKPIYPFKTLEKEAKYWDTRDIVSGIKDETRVGFHRANKTDTLTIRFTDEDLQHLRKKATQKGIGPTTLARMWVKEKLSAGL